MDLFLQAVTNGDDLEWLLVDSAIVRPHHHAAGARIAKAGQMPSAWAASAAG